MSELKSTRKLISFSETDITKVEDWRGSQRPVPSWSEAARRLIQKGLEADKPNQSD